jgi:hypothetical protein
MSEPLTVVPLSALEQQQLVADVRAAAGDLAEKLRHATDRGVSHAIILPQLVLVFRETFGGDFQMPDLAQLGQLVGGPS